MDLTVEAGPNPRTPEKEPSNSRVSSTMATIHDDDELLLARIGYKQVLSPKGDVIRAGHQLI